MLSPSLSCTLGVAPPKAQWSPAALHPTPRHAHRYEHDVRAGSHRYCATDISPLSTICAVVQLVQYLTVVGPPYQCRHGRRGDHRSYHRRCLFRYPSSYQQSSPRQQYILSEVVCAWRAAVLWNYDRRVVAVLMVFLIGATCELYLPSPCLPIRQDHSTRSQLRRESTSAEPSILSSFLLLNPHHRTATRSSANAR